MSNAPQLSRRTLLRGVGTALSLPLLDAMLPRTSLAAATSATAAGGQLPRRMAFLFVPNGVHMPAWTPSSEGTGFELPSILKPLESVRNELTVLTGLTQHNAHALGDGGGDHARSASTFLTGTHPYKTAGANLRAGVSADQVAARTVGQLTRFPSLELGIDRGLQSGNCDSGYSCAYSSNISWKTPSTPMAKEVDPRLVFERLFGGSERKESAAVREKRQAYNKSVLDFVLEDAGDLRRSLGSGDQRKLDEYMTAVREVETRIERAEKFITSEMPKTAKPEGIPPEFAEHVRLMFDLMLLAFQTDQTRIITFMMANEGSNRSYKEISVTEGHHNLSHHGGNAEKQEKIRKINEYHVTLLAHLLEKLRATPEGDSNMLDNSMIVYGSCISDGNRHNHNDLPIVMAGRGGGTISPGRHIRYADKTPLNNLWLAMLNRMGCEAKELGDSTGILKGLEG